MNAIVWIVRVKADLSGLEVVNRLMNEIGIAQFEVKNLELNLPKLFMVICVGPDKKQQRFQLVVTQINALKTLRINSTS